MLLAFIGTGTAAALAFWVLLIGNPWF
jgi:hypothetical protein